jgi:hypothetical protein
MLIAETQKELRKYNDKKNWVISQKIKEAKLNIKHKQVHFNSGLND